MRVICKNKWFKKGTIDPYNSKTRAQVIQSRTNWRSMLESKKEERTDGSLIKNLLVVTQKRRPATGEVVTKQEERILIFRNLNSTLNSKFLF